MAVQPERSFSSLPFSFFDFHQQWWSFVIYIFILIYFFTYSQATPVSLNHFQQASSVWLLVIAPFRHHVGLCITNRPGSDDAIQIKVSPTCSPLQPAGSLAQAKFWQRSYISCVENREETALVFRDFAGTTHTRADFANSFFQKIYALLSKTLLTMPPQFSWKTKKLFLSWS